MNLVRVLEKKVTLKFYASLNVALRDGSSYSGGTMPKGNRMALFVKVPSGDLPKFAKAGDVLEGSFHFFKKVDVSERRLKGFRFSYRGEREIDREKERKRERERDLYFPHYYHP
jgi:hypothetical protein